MSVAGVIARERRGADLLITVRRSLSREASAENDRSTLQTAASVSSRLMNSADRTATDQAQRCIPAGLDLPNTVA